ncbi:hypothetical protein E2C01_003384 [Portunus trituberculatus]|uniref:Uncharacterized protein n=1 Tax=Portunus trituberculatus TaxID=210409 RepID=A0A5B7CQ09_PORTR|nr:hypothetical protein [Portunus trituberculatus]
MWPSSLTGAGWTERKELAVSGAGVLLGRLAVLGVGMLGVLAVSYGGDARSVASPGTEDAEGAVAHAHQISLWLVRY